MVEPQPFAKSDWQRRRARIEFDIFRERAKDVILSASKEVPRFNALERYFSFYVTLDNPDTVQAWFGKRSMFRKDLTGKVASENGACLLYSLGPTGHVAVSLYPSKSTLANMKEDHLYLDIGLYDSSQLLRRVKADMKRLVAYGYVSSLDAEATLSERLLCTWLRWTKSSQVDGEFVPGLWLRLIGRSVPTASRSVLLAFLTAVMKPLGVLFVVALLTWLGMSGWLEYLKGK